MIRNFKPSDYENICSWWKAAEEHIVPLKHMPEETTFVFEFDGNPVASISYLTTNTDIGWVQNFIASPDLNKNERRIASNCLLDYIEKDAKEKGFNFLTGFTSHIKLAQRYQESGYKASAMIFVAKEI